MKLIPLTKGQYAIVDDEDFGRLSAFKWCYASGYAKGWKRIMHRMVVNAPAGLDVDHINGNSLDNRRSNLRICSHADNCRNKRRYSRKKASRFKGVSWEQANKRWAARIRVNYRLLNLGRYKSEHEAAKAYDEAARKHFGDFAFTNSMFP